MIECPNCGAAVFAVQFEKYFRSRKDGSSIGVTPYRCEGCNHRFQIFDNTPTVQKKPFVFGFDKVSIVDRSSIIVWRHSTQGYWTEVEKVFAPVQDKKNFPAQTDNPLD